MTRSISLALLTLVILFGSCNNGHSQAGKTSLTPAEFSEKIKEFPAAQVVDVRTAEEFSKGHLPEAVNYDWNGKLFKQQTASLDKKKPVFVYCLSGGRSSAAADKLRSEGFANVYELDGGLMKWRAGGLPEIADNPAAANGMSKEQFDALIASDKLVLVDFYADWCAPCKKMKPYLDEIFRDMADRVIVIRINADDNRDLCKALQIEELPVLRLYKNRSLTWTNTGFIEKPDVVKQLQ